MNLTALANVAEIIGAVIVIGGLAFGVIQLQQYRLQRRARAAIEVARSFQDAEFSRALRLVLSLPRDLGADEVRELGGKYEDAAMLVSLTVEAIGLMVFRRMVSLQLVWELMGGVLLNSWDRLGRWTRDTRREQGGEKFNEWMQWLAVQLERHKATCDPEPAYLKFDKWNPRGSEDRASGG